MGEISSVCTVWCPGETVIAAGEDGYVSFVHFAESEDGGGEFVFVTYLWGLFVGVAEFVGFVYCDLWIRFGFWFVLMGLGWNHGFMFSLDTWLIGWYLLTSQYPENCGEVSMSSGSMVQRRLHRPAFIGICHLVCQYTVSTYSWSMFQTLNGVGWLPVGVLRSTLTQRWHLSEFKFSATTWSSAIKKRWHCTVKPLL